MKLSFCRTCGRITLRGFVYCPYCGVALRPGPDLPGAAGMPFDRLETMQAEFRARRIEEMLAALEGLEDDVEELMHGIGSPS